MCIRDSRQAGDEHHPLFADLFAELAENDHHEKAAGVQRADDGAHDRAGGAKVGADLTHHGLMGGQTAAGHERGQVDDGVEEFFVAR